MSPTQITVLIVVLIAVVVLAGVAWMLLRRRALRQRFGPEYDRLVSEQDSRAAAERELRERERRHADLELRPLSPESRATYAAAWEELQIRFVDSPNDAVAAGDELVSRLIAERGYPTGDYDEQVAHLSVEHARTLGHYRDAHDIYLRHERGEATTEQLRQAIVHYRALFADLLGTDPVPDPDRAHPDQSHLDRADPDQANRDQAHPDQTHPDPAHADHGHPDRAVSGPAASEPVSSSAPARLNQARPNQTRPTAPQDAPRP